MIIQHVCTLNQLLHRLLRESGVIAASQPIHPETEKSYMIVYIAAVQKSWIILFLSFLCRSLEVLSFGLTVIQENISELHWHINEDKDKYILDQVNI